MTATLVSSAVLAVLTAPFFVPLVLAALDGGSVSVALAGMLGSLSGGAGALASGWLAFYQVSTFATLSLTLTLFLIWCAFFVIYGLAEKTKNPARELEDGAFGSQTSEKRQFAIYKRCFHWRGGEPKHVGFVVGYAFFSLVVSAAIHAVIIAPSGSYKTRASVLPSVACISYSGSNNLVITDPSLEIFCYTRPMLERRGYRVVLIDLDNPYRGDRINFLLPLVKLHHAGQDHLVEERAAEIGAMLFPETGREGDTFSQPAAGLVAAVSYIVATSDDVPDGQRHLYSVMRIILDGATVEGSSRLKEWLKSHGSDSPAVAMAATFLSATDRYEASILGTLHTGLRPFNTTAMRYLVSGDGFDPDEFLVTPTALVLHTLSPGMPGNNAASLLLSQLWAATVRNGQRRGANRSTYYLLDEAHSIPPFCLPVMMEQSRKYDVHIALYLQSISGLDPYKTAKEDGADAILANCDCKMLMRAGSVKDAEYFERISGKATYLARNTGKSRSSRDASSSTGYSERERPVWMAGDIMQRDPMKDGVLLFQNPTNYPKMMGKFEPRIKEITEVKFLVDEFGTLGSREYEQRVIGDVIDRLDAIAAESVASKKPVAWVPDFIHTDVEGETEKDSDLFGL